jgi:indole-3-glycerol phosphate synthase
MAEQIQNVAGCGVKPIFIAEIKTKSPFTRDGDEVPNFEDQMNLALEYGDWISVHDNALWGGDFDSISFVRQFTDKPILAKGIHGTDDDIMRALDHGANYVLVVGRMVYDQYLRSKCLFEAPLYFLSNFSYEDLHVVYNKRDLRTGDIDWANGKLPEYLKSGHRVCLASGMYRPGEVPEGVHSFIIGTELSKFCTYLKNGMR